MVDRSWVRNPNDELALARGYTFDESAGDDVIEFIESFCVHSKGEWAGKPFEVLDWQWDFLKRLYGWKRPDGRRRHTRAYCEVPKKNGKSTLISGITLYHLVADGEPSAEVYINAYDRSQATIIFDEAARMVRASRSLNRIVKIIDSRKTIVYQASQSKLLALSADVASKDGVSSSLTVFDELHRQRNPAMWDIFEYAGASRRQPLLLSITTAGYDRNSVCFEQHSHTMKVNGGQVEDLDHLGVIYGATETDDWKDPETWRKANPSLGVTIREEDFAREVADATTNPRKLNGFLRLRLNVWTRSETAFLSGEAWEACGAVRFEETDLIGRECYGGLDLASTTDLAAFCLLFPDDSGIDRAIWRCWIPEESAERRELRDKVPYRMWARQGFLTMTPGNVIDYDFIRDEIISLSSHYDIRQIDADPWNATQLCGQLAAAGLEVQYIRQGFSSISGSTKELERRTLGRRIAHGNNPVATWCSGNAVSEEDASGNLKLSKSKSSEKIDLIIALVNAIAAETLDHDDEGESVYAKRGILTL